MDASTFGFMLLSNHFIISALSIILMYAMLSRASIIDAISLNYQGYYKNMNDNNVNIECDGKHLWTVKDKRTGELVTLAYDSIICNGIQNYLIPGRDGKWFRIASSEEVDKKPVRCIKVDADDHLFLAQRNVMSHNTGGGKSVLQRLVAFHTVAFSKEIKFLGIDLKRVELAPYTVFSDTVLGIGITLEDAVEILKFGNEQMMKRYDQMQKAGVNNFADLPNHGPAILIMVDECGQLLDMSGGKGSDEAKAEGELKGQAQSIIGSIARLGRAAGVHLVLATQRPDSKMIPGELKENLMFRAGCGHLTSIASSMLFDDATGTQTPANPKGRAAVMQVGQKPQKIQVYFTKDYKWMIDWLAKKGLNPDLTPLSTGPAVNTNAASAGNLQNMQLDNNDADIDALAAERQAQADAHAAAVQQMDANNAGMSSSMDFDKPQLKGADGPKKHDPRDDWDADMDELVD